MFKRFQEHRCHCVLFSPGGRQPSYFLCRSSVQRWWPISPPFWVDPGILQKLQLFFAEVKFCKTAGGDQISFFGISNVTNVYKCMTCVNDFLIKISHLAWQYTAAPEIYKKRVFLSGFLSFALLALFVTYGLNVGHILPTTNISLAPGTWSQAVIVRRYRNTTEGNTPETPNAAAKEMHWWSNG